MLFIDGVRRAVNTMHRIRLMGESSEVCSGGGDVSVCFWQRGVIIQYVCVRVCVCPEN